MSDGIVHVPRIYNTVLHDVYYDLQNKNFILRKPVKRVRPVNHSVLTESSEFRFRPIKWKEQTLNYTNKKGVDQLYKYRFALIPQDHNYIRVKEGEFEKFLKGE
jgi:hypothetical protein